MDPIYLDYNATTPIDPLVFQRIAPYLETHFGNPSSSHIYGERTKDAVSRARHLMAELIGADSDEIVFTGGGSEANNQVLKGIERNTDSHIITSVIEHPAIEQPCRFLESLGCQVTRLPVDQYGVVNPDDVRSAITSKTVLVSIMHSNNEVGTLQPIKEIATICRENGVYCHTDAAQSLGKVPVNVNELGVDFLSVAGHKLYAPKGVGALYVRKGVSVGPLIHGASHEQGRRAGTENVPYLAGLGKACRLASESFPDVTTKLQKLRDRLWKRLQGAFGDRVILNGHPENRLPNTLNVNFVGHVGAELLAKAEGIAASTGSACHEGQVKLSGVLKAMGVSPELGKGAIRLSVGRFSTDEEMDRAAEQLIRAAK